MKTLKQKKISDIKFVGIILVEEWLEKWSLPIEKDDFVVCTWSDFHDGVNSHIEGKTTIAICKNPEDAELIFHRHGTRL